MYDDVHSKCNRMLPDLFGNGALERMSAGARDGIGGRGFGILKAQLNMVEAGFHQVAHARRIQANSGGNQIDVELGLTRRPD